MKIDHVFWYSADLAFGEAYFSKRTGIKPVFSGQHPGGRTRNSIFATSDSSFLDIVAMDPEQPPDIAGNAEVIALLGQTSGVLTGGRIRPSGEWLGWKVVGIRGHTFGALVPFFIEWTNATHPALEARIGGRMVDVIIHSPRADELAALFDALGIRVAVSNAPSAAIEATLDGVDGTYALRSFNPLPKGFAI